MAGKRETRSTFEEKILNNMNVAHYSQVKWTVKKCFSGEKKPKRRSLQELKDRMILIVHELNCMEQSELPWDEENRIKAELIEGELRGILYALGYDIRM